MTHAREMLDTHPGTAAMDADALIECIEACFDCSQSCSACADACLGEEMVGHLKRCITMCLNCSDVCATTGRVVSRQTAFEPAMARAAIRACAEACGLCAEECEQHAMEMDMEHSTKEAPELRRILLPGTSVNRLCGFLTCCPFCSLLYPYEHPPLHDEVGDLNEGREGPLRLPPLASCWGRHPIGYGEPHNEEVKGHR